MNEGTSNILLVGDSAVGKAAAIAVVYDATAKQKILVDKESNIYAVVTPYDDDLYLQNQKDLIEKINELIKNGSKNGDEREVTIEEVKEALEFDAELFDQLIETLENYPDLPSDWKALIPHEDKQSIVRKANTFIIDEDNKRFSLGKTIVPTACYVDGKAARQQHTLRRRTLDDSSRYALILSKEVKPEKVDRLDGKVVNLRVSQHQAKWELYLEMRESVTGFANDKVPMRVGIMVIDYIFADLLPKK